MRQIALLIMGMHRSGTSAITRVLNLLGAHLPHALLPPQPDNPTGFWESQEMVRFNDALLHQQGLAWDSLQPLQHGQAAMLARGDLGVAASELLRDTFADAPLIVIKDPRLSRLLPFWMPVFQASGIDMRFVFTVRQPMEVVLSLQQRSPIPTLDALLLWASHLLEAERDSRGCDRVFITYHALLEDWHAVLAHVAQALRLTWPHAPQDVAAEINAFFHAGTRHHHTLAADPAAPAPQRWAQELYHLAACAHDGADRRATWDGMGTTLELVMLASEAVRERLQRHADEAQHSAEHRLAACQHLIITLQRQLAEQQAQRQRLIGDLRAQLKATQNTLQGPRDAEVHK